MVVGIGVLVAVAYFVSESTKPAVGDLGGWSGTRYDPDACYVDGANLKLGLAMYASYFVLFALFFWQRYMHPEEENPKKNKNK